MFRSSLAWLFWVFCAVAVPIQAAPLLIGAHVHLSNSRTDPDMFFKQNQHVAMNSFRADVAWWDVETAKGQYTLGPALAALDRSISLAVQRGMHPILVLAYGNGFYDQGRFPITDEAQDAFCRYVDFVVRHYKGKVRYYELWNEWNIGLGTGYQVPHSYPGSAIDYARLLSKAYKTIKNVDPNATVVMAAAANRDTRWIMDAVKAASPNYDGIAVHPYNWASGPDRKTPEEAIDWTMSLDRAIMKLGNVKRAPLYVTEMGWPNYSGANTTDPELGASFLSRFFFLAPPHTSIKGIWWYDYRDDGDTATDPEHRFGLVNRDYSLKPAMAAMRDVNRVLNDVTSASFCTIAVGIRCVRFQANNGALTQVAWSASGATRRLCLQATRPDTTVTARVTGKPSTVQLVRLRQDTATCLMLLSDRPLIVTGDVSWTIFTP